MAASASDAESLEDDPACMQVDTLPPPHHHLWYPVPEAAHAIVHEHWAPAKSSPHLHTTRMLCCRSTPGGRRAARAAPRQPQLGPLLPPGPVSPAARRQPPPCPLPLCRRPRQRHLHGVPGTQRLPAPHHRALLPLPLPPNHAPGLARCHALRGGGDVGGAAGSCSEAASSGGLPMPHCACHSRAQQGQAGARPVFPPLAPFSGGC